MRDKNHLPYKSIPIAHRPFSVTILIVVVLIFTSLNILRLIKAIVDHGLLTTLPLDVPVIYLAITGALWSAIGLILAFGLFARYRWSLLMGQLAAVIYTAYYWLDQLLFADQFAVENDWQFSLGLNLILASLAFWILRRPITKAFAHK
jgi:hypothetical protein